MSIKSLTQIPVLEAQATLPTIFGQFVIRGYRCLNKKSIVLLKGNIKGGEEVLTRIQSSCLFGESFHAINCDCNWQIMSSLRRISMHNNGGIFIYLFQEGRGIGIFKKINALGIQQQDNCDTVDAFAKMGYKENDFRTYDVAAAILKSEEVQSVKLLTNNSRKTDSLLQYGIPTTRVPLEIEEEDIKKLIAQLSIDDIDTLIHYLISKREKLGHSISNTLAQKFLVHLRSTRSIK